MPRRPSLARPLRGILVFFLLLALVTVNALPAHAASLSFAAPKVTLPPVAAAPAAPALEVTGGDPHIKNVAAIDGGGLHGCLLLVTGAVQCWGEEDYIGRTPAGSSSRPVNIESGNRAFKQVSAGLDHSCGVTTAANVMCWGENLWGQLGNNSFDQSEKPDSVVNLSDVKSVSSGYALSCAVTNNGEVWCWGSNAYKGLGGATGENRSALPLKVPNLAGIQDVSVGYWNVCVVTNVGAVKCWGKASPVLGLASGEPVASPQDVPVLTGGATAVSVGMNFACAIVSATAQCWGSNSSGELGQGYTSAIETIPATATGLESGVSALSVGDDHGCAIQNGALKCWGSNGSGQVGNGTTIDQSTPIVVPGLQSGVAGVGVGSIHSCAALADGTARCWGSKDDSRLGTGAYVPLSPPVKVSALISPTTAVDTGNSFTCAISGGALKCWGAGTNGQLGNGANDNSNAPVQVGAGFDSGVTEIATGATHACAVKGDDYYCWGQNAYGQLGIGNNDNKNLPTAIGTATDIQLAGGAVHTCAAIGDSAYCWGSGANGRLGTGNTSDTNVPAGVSGFSPGPIVSAVDAGTAHSCAVIDAAPAVTYVYCWGENLVGQLGDGSTSESNVPVQVRVSVGGDPIAADEIVVSTGAAFTCAIFDGAAKCWGINTSGQLGGGNDIYSTVPAQVAGLTTGATDISTGESHACAVVDGDVLCWGSNYSQQLGNATVPSSSAPVQVFLPGSASTVRAGLDHTCAIVGTDLYCWGSNQSGQIGISPWAVPQMVAAGDPQPYKLTLQVTGGGSVASSPLGINCGTACVAVYLPGAGVNLTSSPYPGGSFLGWGGACSGNTVTCPLTMNADTTVNANFKPFYTLGIGVEGTGSVTSVPAGITCPTNCLVSAVEGTSYTLTAHPGTGQKFVEWEGECGGEDETCTVSLTEDLATTVYFEPQVFALNVNKTGEGTITIDPGGAPCNAATCSGSFAYSTPVSIAAVAAPGWTYTGWTGACSGTISPCYLNMTQARTVGATFTYVNTNLDPNGLIYKVGFAYPQDAPHLFGRFFYTGTVDAGDVLTWSVTESDPPPAASNAEPAGAPSFRITAGGELYLDDPDLTRGEHVLTVALTDGRGSTISREITVEVASRIFAPLVDAN